MHSLAAIAVLLTSNGMKLEGGGTSARNSHTASNLSPRSVSRYMSILPSAPSDSLSLLDSGTVGFFRYNIDRSSLSVILGYFPQLLHAFPEHIHVYLCCGIQVAV